jgi:tetratricopeptide (TPR) repeat protein
MALTNQLNASLLDIELAKVRAFTRANQLDEAKNIIENLYNNYFEDNLVLLIYAEYLIKAQDFLKAKKILNESLKINSKNYSVFKLIGIVSTLEKDYKNALNVFLIAEKLIAPSTNEEYIEIIYYIGLTYYRLEKFHEASIYLFYAQRIDHTFWDLFYLASELTVINNILKSYERQKDDRWFLLAAYKTFRRYGHKEHQEKFLNEIKEKHPVLLEYELIKLELEILDYIDKDASNYEFYELHQKWIQKNYYAGCVFVFQEIGSKKRNFEQRIVR